MKIVLLVVTLLLVSACSAGQFNRAVYNTMDNMGRQQCSRQTLEYCDQQSDYETYKKEREAADKPD